MEDQIAALQHALSNLEASAADRLSTLQTLELDLNRSRSDVHELGKNKADLFQRSLELENKLEQVQLFHITKEKEIRQETVKQLKDLHEKEIANKENEL